jgi:DNA-binding response OmpR family regulator
MKTAVVLIVEKDRSSAAEAVEALREAGYEVVEATDPADGLKMIYEVRPDVVIASTGLPSVGGEDACLRLRQASYLPMIAIGRKEEVVEMLELGADACIVGPPSGREVVARVNSLLKRRGDDEPPGDQIQQPIDQ